MNIVERVAKQKGITTRQVYALAYKRQGYSRHVVDTYYREYTKLGYITEQVKIYCQHDCQPKG